MQKAENVNLVIILFNSIVVSDQIVYPTLTSSGHSFYYEEMRNVSDKEYTSVSTFPSDYKFGNSKVRYVCGMSVPPLMIYGIASEMRKQWFQV